MMSVDVDPWDMPYSWNKCDAEKRLFKLMHTVNKSAYYYVVVGYTTFIFTK